MFIRLFPKQSTRTDTQKGNSDENYAQFNVGNIENSFPNRPRDKGKQKEKEGGSAKLLFCGMKLSGNKH